ncbi:ABC transporter ATP-binding protein [Bacilliculturomica massiliensis]|uniref:ABC transporter ATP-binding protein n=1 Tax=Bacilliculturomica massiliensis TaxID=1917867 RepID=UPI00103243C0|nr:ABC transporter ATP-binding protein [Bacilliculturomica massiliensis]
MEEKVLDVKNLSIDFHTSRGCVKAVDRVSFDVKRGEVFALVGESGCGKSTTAMGIMQLIRSPGIISGGEVVFGGRDLLKLSREEMTGVRGRDIGMIFQNPLDSLNPVYTIGAQMTEGLLVEKMDKKQAWQVARDMLRDVKISDVEQRMKSFPHEISGGMRQRVMIGMMLCRNPKLLIADEPTTALDVTIQAGIIELMNELRRKFNSAVLIITHDFGIVADIADRVGVMYAGNLIETADVMTIFDRPRHPYTRLLMKALPTITKDEGRLETIKGTVPNLAEERPGCNFADRCPYAMQKCREQKPEWKECEPGHFCACFLEEGGTARE